MLIPTWPPVGTMTFYFGDDTGRWDYKPMHCMAINAIMAALWTRGAAIER